MEVLDSGGRPRNGSAIVAAIKGSRYRSAMGWVLAHLTANPAIELTHISIFVSAITSTSMRMAMQLEIIQY